jgi:hypothetical protein
MSGSSSISRMKVVLFDTIPPAFAVDPPPSRGAA